MSLTANTNVSGMGVALHGSGFILDPETAERYRPYGTGVIKPYLGGSDLLRARRERYLIDFSFMTKDEARASNPIAFQHVIDFVKPERDVNRRTSIRELWWRFGWERPLVRRAIDGLPRFIATTETAKHRIFQFVDSSVLPDHMIVVIALDCVFHLGVLSSRVHVTWALAAGGTLEDRPRYNKTRCFEPFPFPAATDAQQAHIRGLAEQLDAHRKRQQAQHPKLTLTDMYNVLEKLRAGEPLTAKDKTVHEQGLVSVLRQLHDELDAAVCDAYGWPVTLTDEEILARLVALNAERAAEEAQGLVRWLRPEYQAPSDHASRITQHALIQEDAPVYEVSLETRPLLPWPARMAEQAQAVRAALVALGGPASRRRKSPRPSPPRRRARRRVAGDAGHAGAGAADGRGAVRGVAGATTAPFLSSADTIRT